MSRTEPPRPTGRAERRAESRLTGMAVSPGIAIGIAYTAKEQAMVVSRGTIAADSVQGEIDRLDAAVQTSRKQLGKLRTKLTALPEDSQKEIAPCWTPICRCSAPRACCARRRSASPSSC